MDRIRMNVKDGNLIETTIRETQRLKESVARTAVHILKERLGSTKPILELARDLVQDEKLVLVYQEYPEEGVLERGWFCYHPDGRPDSITLPPSKAITSYEIRDAAGREQQFARTGDWPDA